MCGCIKQCCQCLWNCFIGLWQLFLCLLNVAFWRTTFLKTTCHDHIPTVCHNNISNIRKMCGCTCCALYCAKCLGKKAIFYLKKIIFGSIVLAAGLGYMLAGCFMIGLSIYILVEEPAKTYDAILADFSSEVWDAGIWTMMIVGIVLFIVGFLGFCGSCKDDTCMLCWYSILMVGVVLLQVAAATLFIVFESEISGYLEDSMYDQVHYDYTHFRDNTSEISMAWDSLQQDYECCGANNYTDYKGSNFYNTTGELVPASCCYFVDITLDFADTYADCLLEAATPPDEGYQVLYPDGCHDEFSSDFTDKQPIIYGILFAVIILEILAIISALCMRCGINNKE